MHEYVDEIPGYITIPSSSSCTGCALDADDYDDLCLSVNCTAEDRKDNTDVNFHNIDNIIDEERKTNE